MLEKEEKRKIPVKCPYCKNDQHIGDFGWLGIFDDLDMFGKTVMSCANCNRYYLIREEDDTGPFVTS